MRAVDERTASTCSPPTRCPSTPRRTPPTGAAAPAGRALRRRPARAAGRGRRRLAGQGRRARRGGAAGRLVHVRPARPRPAPRRCGGPAARWCRPSPPPRRPGRPPRPGWTAGRPVRRRRRPLGHLHPGAAARAAPAPRPGRRRARPPPTSRSSRPGGSAPARTSGPPSRPAPRRSRSARSLLLAPEAGTNPAHRAGLVAATRPRRPDARPTPRRSAAARPAALRNGLPGGVRRAEARSGYPALHHLTSPIRRARRGAGADPEHVNLWAGDRLSRRRSAERPARRTRSCSRAPWGRARSPSSGSSRGHRCDRRAAP